MLPWKVGCLKEWAIVGMNHYHVDGERRLFVAMVKDDKCIKVEGPDDDFIWTDLEYKALSGLQVGDVEVRLKEGQIETHSR